MRVADESLRLKNSIKPHSIKSDEIYICEYDDIDARENAWQLSPSLTFIHSSLRFRNALDDAIWKTRWTERQWSVRER